MYSITVSFTRICLIRSLDICLLEEVNYLYSIQKVYLFFGIDLEFPKRKTEKKTHKGHEVQIHR
jgi:hypothetical protein